MDSCRVRDMLQYQFANRSKQKSSKILPNQTAGETTQVTDTKSSMMHSLISRAGDLRKNNDRLKFALVSIRFPTAYDEEQ